MAEFIPAAKPLIGDEEREAVDRVLRSGMVAQGPEVAAFEEEFGAAMVDGRACVAVNSGTSALHIGLLASGVGAGDEVIVPSFTFAATGNSVALTGAKPVFADVDPNTFCLDPASVEASITENTKGILPVHLYGLPANLDEIRAIADKHGVQLFEDCAQAHAASINGKHVGTFGTFGAFSFYPTKNLGAVGDGGAVVLAADAAAQELRAILLRRDLPALYTRMIAAIRAGLGEPRQDPGAIAAEASVTTTTLIAHPLHRAARAAPAAPPARASRTTSGSRRCY